MKKQTLTFGLIMMGIFILTGCEKEEEQMKPVSDMTIAEYTVSDANFSILVEALTKADLVNVLNSLIIFYCRICSPHECRIYSSLQ
ncbi:MAG: hypothetical protein R2758_07505 [Bacteroidales bacterium]